jgi:hypothetical protein
MGVPGGLREIDFFLSELKHASPNLTSAELVTLKDGLPHAESVFN